MTGNDLLEHMEYLDEDIIEAVDESRAVPHPSHARCWYRWAIAACAGLVVTAAAWFLPNGGGKIDRPLVAGAGGTENQPGNAGQRLPEISSNPGLDNPGNTQGGTAEGKKSDGAREPDLAVYDGSEGTSQTYADLPELLAFLGKHENHDGRQDGSGGKEAVSGSIAAALGDEEKTFAESSGVAVIDGKFACHIGKDKVYISRLDGADTVNVGSVDVRADDIFISNDHLVLVSQFQSGGDELDREMSTRVGIYDVSDPAVPALLDEYTQRGERTACWMSGAELFLVTSDGVCACGWSRLADTDGYYPAFARNGKSVEWGDELVSILGEPTRVQYSAMSVINADSREVVARRALYGDIRRLFYGSGWIAASVVGETAEYRENPVIYTFDENLRYSGKIKIAAVVGAAEKYPCMDYVQQAGTHVDIVSLSKAGGIYRMIGTETNFGNKKGQGAFLIITADMERGITGRESLSAEDYPGSSFTEIRWEEDRAIVCVGVMRDVLTDHIRQETRFLIAKFDGSDAVWLESGLTADYLNGRVGEAYGNPLGEFETLIPLGDGIYLRYTLKEDGCPGGFDVFDFSDSADLKCLYHEEDPLCGRDAFDYVWHVYDESTFGTLKVVLGDEVYFRNVGLAWSVYTVDPAAETPVTLLEEYDLQVEEQTFLGADRLGVIVFDACGHSYFVTGKMTTALALR